MHTDLRHSSRMPDESLARRLLKQNVVLLLVAMLVVIPLLGPLTQGIAGRALRNGLCQSLGVLLLVVLVARVEAREGPSRLLYLARSGVNSPVAAFLLWAVVGVWHAPDRAYAVGELLRLGAGALVYFALALHLETRTQLSLLIDCLMGMVILLIGYGVFAQGSEISRVGFSSVFPSRLHLGAILAALLPLLTSLALGLEERGRRAAAIAAAILGGVGLLLCRERGPWVAAAVGVLVWVLLAGRAAAPLRAPRQRRATLIVAATGLLVAIGFFVVTGVHVLVADRSRTMAAAVRGQDLSFAWRVEKWRGAMRMAAERPLWGWGPGQFVLHQAAYTHSGRPPQEIHRDGASFDEMAFNEYMQIAAELGLPGLALYLLILVAFFSKALRALPRLPEGLRRAVLQGCVGGVAAQMVDAAANGSWRFTECSIFFWLLLGIGVAVIRMAAMSPSPATSRPAREWPDQSSAVERPERSVVGTTPVDRERRRTATGAPEGWSMGQKTRYPRRG
jgi:O-antigen ligase